MILNSSAARPWPTGRALGHHITYQLLTCGDKGFNDSTPADMTPDALCAIRHEEQQAAAKVIGVEAVHFMDCKDGYLVPDLDLRRDIVRVIRKFKPDVLVTCDPQTLFARYGINHPDHRAAGQVDHGRGLPRRGQPCLLPGAADRRLSASHAKGRSGVR